MQTPWGPLGSLDLSSHDLCLEILSCDKHQLAEGLVVENLFDQIVDGLPDILQDAHLLDIDTAVVDTHNERIGRWHAFVWIRTSTPGLGRYLSALEKRFRTWVVRLDEERTDFLVREYRNGRSSGEKIPITPFMEQLSGRQASPVSVSPEVRDRARQQQSFWGFLTGTYKSELGEKVIMPRLFLNHAIQRWFRAVWNLDRILVHENRIWLLEIKHKFPFGRKELRFGINRGELGVFSRLSEAGIDCFHAILAKPSWTRDTGSGYLLNQLEQREHAALIGCILDQEVIHRMQQGPQGSSPSHTTFTGAGQLSYSSLPASAFRRLGMITASRAALADSLARALESSGLPQVTDQWLSSLRTE